ncbi:hypothetical protein HUU05_29720 [candidate division KSB1 bacterium]|nr:hypothetical protein [candidate division KSB1 bacterium]
MNLFTKMKLDLMTQAWPAATWRLQCRLTLKNIYTRVAAGLKIRGNPTVPPSVSNG